MAVSKADPFVDDATDARPVPRPRGRFSRGRRPFFMDDPDVDRLLAIVTALTGEVATMRERLDTVTRLARQGLPATPENIDAFSPSLQDEEERDAARAAMLHRVFRILSLGQFEDRSAEESYQTIVDEIS